MMHTVLLDIDPVLLERIQRIATAHGWGQQDAMIHLLEHESDAKVLQAAIAALQEIPDDPGFSLIGRAVEPGGGSG